MDELAKSVGKVLHCMQAKCKRERDSLTHFRNKKFDPIGEKMKKAQELLEQAKEMLKTGKITQEKYKQRVIQYNKKIQTLSRQLATEAMKLAKSVENETLQECVASKCFRESKQNFENLEKIHTKLCQDKRNRYNCRMAKKSAKLAAKDEYNAQDLLGYVEEEKKTTRMKKS